jgi:hypothetical protein
MRALYKAFAARSKAGERLAAAKTRVIRLLGYGSRQRAILRSEFMSGLLFFAFQPSRDLYSTLCFFEENQSYGTFL